VLKPHAWRRWDVESKGEKTQRIGVTTCQHPGEGRRRREGETDSSQEEKKWRQVLEKEFLL